MNWLDKELYRGILMGDYKRRNTKKDKQAFINLLKETFQYFEPISFTLPAIFLPFIKGKNLVIGDVDNADVILTAHYDTPSVPPGNYLFSQKHFVLRIKNSTFYRTLIAFPVLACIAFNFTVCMFYLFTKVRQLSSHYVGIVIVTAILTSLFLAGYSLFAPNKNNANDNSSGVCMVLHLYQEIPNIAVILFDNEEKGKFGSKAMKSAFQNDPRYKGKLFINFDTIGCRDILLLSQDNEAFYFEERSSYQGKQVLNGFENNKHTDYTSLPIGKRVGISTNNGNANKKRTRNHGPIHSVGDTTVDFEMMAVVEVFAKAVIVNHRQTNL